jgi:hypothetical protein
MLFMGKERIMLNKHIITNGLDNYEFEQQIASSTVSGRRKEIIAVVHCNTSRRNDGRSRVEFVVRYDRAVRLITNSLINAISHYNGIQ